MCRSRRELSNAYLVAKFGFDTAEIVRSTAAAAAENEPSKVGRIPRRRPVARSRSSAQVYSFLVPSDDLLADPEDIRVAFQWWWKLDPRFTGLIQTSEFLKEILVCRDQSTAMCIPNPS